MKTCMNCGTELDDDNTWDDGDFPTCTHCGSFEDQQFEQRSGR